MNDEYKFRMAALQAAATVIGADLRESVITQEVDGMILIGDGKAQAVIDMAEKFERYIDDQDNDATELKPLNTDEYSGPTGDHLRERYGVVKNGKRVPS